MDLLGLGRWSHHWARSSALALACVMVPVGTARAEPPGQGVPVIHVVAIQSEDVDDQADALTAALRSRVRAMHGFSLGDGDASLEVLTLGLKCNVRDPRCQTKIGDQLRADRYVWGTVARSSSSKQVVAALHLWTRGEVPTETKITYSDGLTAPGDEALKRLVDTALTHLVGRRPPPPNGAPPSPTSAAIDPKAAVVASSSLTSGTTPEAHSSVSSLSSLQIPRARLALRRTPTSKFVLMDEAQRGGPESGSGARSSRPAFTRSCACTRLIRAIVTSSTPMASATGSTLARRLAPGSTRRSRARHHRAKCRTFAAKQRLSRRFNSCFLGLAPSRRGPEFSLGDRQRRAPQRYARPLNSDPCRRTIRRTPRARADFLNLPCG